jgi:hypothetical protein
MDNLIARLDRVTRLLREFAWGDSALATDEAATALRASAEREKELREALKTVKEWHAAALPDETMRVIDAALKAPAP